MENADGCAFDDLTLTEDHARRTGTRNQCAGADDVIMMTKTRIPRTPCAFVVSVRGRAPDETLCF